MSKGYSKASMYAVAWKHYTKSSRSMTGFKDSTVKPAMTTKQIDDEINKIRQQIAKLENN